MRKNTVTAEAATEHVVTKTTAATTRRKSRERMACKSREILVDVGNRGAICKEAMSAVQRAVPLAAGVPGQT